jgi:UDP-glucose 4-epimerase
LAEAILKENHEVLILDDLSTGNAENINCLKAYGGMQYWIDSISNRSLLAELVDECDIVFHLAAAVGVRLIVESPVHTIETNVTGTELVLKAANKKKKPVFIASTSEVYGKSTRVPFGEDDDLVLGTTTKGRWSYAASKALDEFLALAYWREKKLPVIIARFFNIVGPRQSGRYGMVFPNFISKALANSDVPVFGTGQQTRCFCYVGDAVQAVLKLVANPESIGEIFNIGTDQEISIENLANKIVQKLASKSRIHYVPYDQAYGEGFEDMLRRLPSLEKVKKLTGWCPETSLDACIDLVARYIEQGARWRTEKHASSQSGLAAGA